MVLYALSLQPLIMRLQVASTVKQCWFCGDVSGAGTATEIKRCWDTLITLGPDLDYFPKDKKCLIIAKQGKEEAVRKVFKETVITISVGGQKHLGAVIGSRQYRDDYLSEVSEWVSEVVQLAEFALTQPQACYAAYTFGLGVLTF